MNTNLQHRLRSHLLELIRERDPYLASGGRVYVRHYIQQQWQDWGPIATQEFRSQGQSHQNLLLDLPGQDLDRPPILVGAHYDAAPGSPGADDNATGVAVLLELARLLTQEPAHYPIRLVAFDFEETIYDAAGSTHYAQSLQTAPLRLMLSLEMLGYCDPTPGSQTYPLPWFRRFYPDRGDFVGLIGNLKSVPDLFHLRTHLRRAGVPCECLPVPDRGRLLPDTRRSDHAPFWDRGDRALMVTDTAHLRNPHYHRASDRFDTLNLEFLTGICVGLAAGLRTLKRLGGWF